MKLGLYWRYATRSLLRGGQRSLLAIFCIAVGVMAIIALQLVGLSINNALTGNVREINGGDLNVQTLLSSFSDKDKQYFDQLKSSGQVTDYAVLDQERASTKVGSHPTTSLSLDAVSANYPLVGQPNFTEPQHDLRLQDLMNGNNVAVSSHVIDATGAHLGDTISVKTQGGQRLDVKIAAIFKDGGAFNGSVMLVNIDTWNAVPGIDGNPVPSHYSAFYLNVPQQNIDALKQQLTNKYQGAQISTVADQLKSQQENVSNIRLFLQIVGLVALFIGGIGIINTMQVLLRRRQLEIAMLKTTGYRQTDLYPMFGLEAGLLGLIGGVLGSALAIGASQIVSYFVGRAFFLDLPVMLDWGVIGSGVLIGFATALIFGLLPIVQSSQTRPISVLRDTSENTRSSFLLTAGLLLLLSLLFVGLAWSILGDSNPVRPALIVYGGAILLFALASGFGLLVFLVSKLPVYERATPKILLWVLLGLGVAIGGGIAGGLLIGAGSLFTLIAAQIGLGGIGTYGAVVFGGPGLVLIGGTLVYFLATIVDAIVMLMPRSWKTAVMFAYRNMGRQRLRTTTTLTALFVGVFTIGLVLVLGTGIQHAISSIIGNIYTRNVYVTTSLTKLDAVKAVVAGSKGIDNSKTQVTAISSVKPIAINGTPIDTILANNPDKQGFTDGKTLGNQGILVFLGDIEGFNLSDSSQDLPAIDQTGVTNGGRNLTREDAGTNRIVVSNTLQEPPLNLKLGDTITLGSSPDGAVTRELQIVGFSQGNSFTNRNLSYVLTDSSVTNALSMGHPIEAVGLKVTDLSVVPNLQSSIEQVDDRASVVNLADISVLVAGVFNNLIIMLTAIASLALIASLVIIANAVALAMLERRREIGILKTVGHSTGSVLATVLVENALVGLLGSLVAMALVFGLISLLNVTVFSKTTIGFGPGLTLLVIGLTSLVTMLISALVAWDASRVRPLQVLRYE